MPCVLTLVFHVIVYSGMSRSKNALTMIMLSMCAMSVVTIQVSFFSFELLLRTGLGMFFLSSFQEGEGDRRCGWSFIICRRELGGVTIKHPSDTLNILGLTTRSRRSEKNFFFFFSYDIILIIFIKTTMGQSGHTLFH
jgi:hypothetical protein